MNSTNNQQPTTNNQQPTNDNLKLADYYLGFLRNLTPTTIFAISGISLFKQNYNIIGIILLFTSILILLVNTYEFAGKLDKLEQESQKIIKNPVAILIGMMTLLFLFFGLYGFITKQFLATSPATPSLQQNSFIYVQETTVVTILSLILFLLFYPHYKKTKYSIYKIHNSRINKGINIISLLIILMAATILLTSLLNTILDLYNSLLINVTNYPTTAITLLLILLSLAIVFKFTSRLLLLSALALLISIPIALKLHINPKFNFIYEPQPPIIQQPIYPNYSCTIPAHTLMEFETSLISKLRQEIENIMPIDEKLLQRPDQVQKLERYYSLNLTHQTNIETDIKITCTPQMNEQKEKLNHQP